MTRNRLTFLWILPCIFCQVFVEGISPPSNLQIAELGSDSVTVVFTPPLEGADRFEASISPIDEEETVSPQFYDRRYVTFDNLIPGKNYTVTIRSIAEGTAPNHPAEITITTESRDGNIPATPYNVKISKFINPIMTQYRVTGSRTVMYPVYGAVVSWEQPGYGYFDNFVLKVDPPHGTVRVPITLKSGTPSQKPTQQRRIVWDLLPGVLYSFTIESSSNGFKSAPVSGGERMPPEMPGPITVEETAPTNALISWEEEHRGILDGFSVETDPEGGVAEQVHEDPEHKRRKVTNLTPGTKYKMEVYSTMDNLLSFKPRTVELSTPPATPLGPVAVWETMTESVLIAWKVPPGRVDYYEVLYFPSDRDFGRLRERVFEANANLTILDPGSSYEIEVYAFSYDKPGIPLKSTVYTLPLPPNNVITTSTHDQILMSWETAYRDGGGRVEYHPENDETRTTTVSVDPGITELSITDLEPSTSYVVKIFNVKNGVESEAVMTTTKTQAEITKAPPSDNPFTLTPQTAAAEETSTTTTSTAASTTSTTAATTTTTTTTTTPATTTTTEQYEALVEESTAAEDDETTAPATAPTTTTTTVQSSTSKRQQTPAVGSSTAGAEPTQTTKSTTPITSKLTEATKKTVDDTPATTKTIATTTKSSSASPTERQHVATTSESTTPNIRPEETTGATATTVSTTAASSTVGPTEPTTKPEEELVRTQANKATTQTAEESTAGRTEPTTQPSTKATTTSGQTTSAQEQTTSPDEDPDSGTTFIPFPLFPDFPEGPDNIHDNPFDPSPTNKTEEEHSTKTSTTQNLAMPQDIVSGKGYRESRLELGDVEFRPGKEHENPVKLIRGEEKRVLNAGWGLSDAVLENEGVREPVVKAGEINVDRRPQWNFNTVGIGYTLPPHLSVPYVIFGKTVKPFPTTLYFPGRITTDPQVTPTPIPAFPTVFTPYTVPPTATPYPQTPAITFTRRAPVWPVMPVMPTTTATATTTPKWTGRQTMFPVITETRHSTDRIVPRTTPSGRTTVDLVEPHKLVTTPQLSTTVASPKTGTTTPPFVTRTTTEWPFQRTSSIAVEKTTTTLANSWRTTISNNRETTDMATRPTAKVTKSTTRRSTWGPTTKVTFGPTTKITRGPTTKVTWGPTTKVAWGPTTKATWRPSTKVTLGPTTKITRGPTTKVTWGPTTKATWRPSTKVTWGPTTKATWRPSTKVTWGPTTKATWRPSTKVTFGPTTKVKWVPTSKVTATPTTKPMWGRTTDATWGATNGITWGPATELTLVHTTSSLQEAATSTRISLSSTSSTRQPSPTTNPNQSTFPTKGNTRSTAEFASTTDVATAASVTEESASTRGIHSTNSGGQITSYTGDATEAYASTIATVTEGTVTPTTLPNIDSTGTSTAYSEGTVSEQTTLESYTVLYATSTNFDSTAATSYGTEATAATATMEDALTAQSSTPQPHPELPTQPSIKTPDKTTVAGVGSKLFPGNATVTTGGVLSGKNDSNSGNETVEYHNTTAAPFQAEKTTLKPDGRAIDVTPRPKTPSTNQILVTSSWHQNITSTQPRVTNTTGPTQQQTTNAVYNTKTSKIVRIETTSTDKHTGSTTTPVKGGATTERGTILTSNTTSDGTETATTVSEVSTSSADGPTTFTMETTQNSALTSNADSTTVRIESTTPTSIDVGGPERLVDPPKTATHTTTQKSTQLSTQRTTPGPTGIIENTTLQKSNVTDSVEQPTTVDETEDIVVTHNRKTVTIRDGFKTICEPNNITVLVDKAVIGKYEEEYGPLHMNAEDVDQACKGVEYERYYRYTIAPNILGCGTQIEVNDTHVNFTNTVSNRRHHDNWYKGMLDKTGTILVGRKDLKPFPLVHMNIYCTFPIEMTVHTDLIPDLRLEVKTFNVSGKGQFSAIMQLFKDEEYSQPHFGAPFLAPDDQLRVGVTLLETKDENISIAVRKCWATPVRAFDFEEFYPLIDDYCPLDEALKGKVDILENGKTKRARWEGPVFRFVTYKEVWLHCELKVCFDDSCNKTCDVKDLPRAKRALLPPGWEQSRRGGAVVSAGPIFAKPVVQREEPTPMAETKPSESDDALNETTVLIIVIVLCTFILISCILFVLILTICRKRLAQRAKGSGKATETSPVLFPVSGSESASSTLSGYHSDRFNWRPDLEQPAPSVKEDLPPVPKLGDGGAFPDSFRVIEEGSPHPREYSGPAPPALSDNSYRNDAFDKSEDHR